MVNGVERCQQLFNVIHQAENPNRLVLLLIAADCLARGQTRAAVLLRHGGYHLLLLVNQVKRRFVLQP